MTKAPRQIPNAKGQNLCLVLIHTVVWSDSSHTSKCLAFKKVVFIKTYDLPAIWIWLINLYRPQLSLTQVILLL